MVERHVEVFRLDGTHNEMESEINWYCRKYNYSPISISVVWSAGIYVAFVVVEERRDSE